MTGDSHRRVASEQRVARFLCWGDGHHVGGRLGRGTGNGDQETDGGSARGGAIAILYDGGWCYG